MKNFNDNILAPLAVAAITAVAVLLFQFNARLTRIETRLDTLAPVNHIAATP